MIVSVPTSGAAPHQTLLHPPSFSVPATQPLRGVMSPLAARPNSRRAADGCASAFPRDVPAEGAASPLLAVSVRGDEADEDEYTPHGRRSPARERRQADRPRHLPGTAPAEGLRRHALRARLRHAPAERGGRGGGRGRAGGAAAGGATTRRTGRMCTNRMATGGSSTSSGSTSSSCRSLLLCNPLFL